MRRGQRLHGRADVHSRYPAQRHAGAARRSLRHLLPPHRCSGDIMSDQPNRRDFLKTVGTVGATGIAAAVGVESPVDAQTTAAKSAPAAAPVSHAYTFLTAPEAAFIEAAVDRLIPADDLTPGGTDCGVAVFIDRQLAGAWGSGDRMYMQGPWAKDA